MQLVSFFSGKICQLEDKSSQRRGTLDYGGGRRKEGRGHCGQKGFCLGDFLYVP